MDLEGAGPVEADMLELADGAGRQGDLIEPRSFSFYFRIVNSGSGGGSSSRQDPRRNLQSGVLGPVLGVGVVEDRRFLLDDPRGALPLALVHCGEAVGELVG